MRANARVLASEVGAISRAAYCGCPVSVLNLCRIPFCGAFLEVIHCLGQQ